MNRFFWLLRREMWEHKAIWITPAIMIGCLLVLLLMTSRAHLGDLEVGTSFDALSAEAQITLHRFAYSIVTALVFWVMGVIAFFYCIDTLYSDRIDRSILFWKSLPLSDAETVLSKFATATVVIPVVALVAALAAQLLIGGGLMAKLAMSGHAAGLWWHPSSLAGGAIAALVATSAAVLWYAPLVAYLMLASAWAPKAPFLWAVLPPVAAGVLEAVVVQTHYVRDFLVERVFGMFRILEVDRAEGEGTDTDIQGLGQLAEKLGEFDLATHAQRFFSLPELWLGLVAAALLLAAAMWVRRYREETT